LGVSKGRQQFASHRQRSPAAASRRVDIQPGLQTQKRVSSFDGGV